MEEKKKSQCCQSWYLRRTEFLLFSSCFLRSGSSESDLPDGPTTLCTAGPIRSALCVHEAVLPFSPLDVGCYSNDAMLESRSCQCKQTELEVKELDLLTEPQCRSCENQETGVGSDRCSLHHPASRLPVLKNVMQT